MYNSLVIKEKRSKLRNPIRLCEKSTAENRGTE